jgi:membrane protease subunit (stomatin/prohibitin family)
MFTSCNAIEDLLKIQDKLQKNLNTLLAATIEACLRMEVPQSQQSDNSLEQLSHDGITQSLKRDMIVCNKCHLNGHLAASCRSSWTKEGKYIGEGEPPADPRDMLRNILNILSSRRKEQEQQHQQQQQQQQQNSNHSRAHQ